jgi:glutamate-1-semialdehyde 2,1-aminomutase
LGELVKDDARALVRIRKLGAELKAGLNKLFKKNGQPMKAVGPDCVFTVISPQLELRDYRDTLKYDLERMKGFYSNMFSRGIWFMARGNFFLSAAHTEKDIEETLEKASLALQG